MGKKNYPIVPTLFLVVAIFFVFYGYRIFCLLAVYPMVATIIKYKLYPVWFSIALIIASIIVSMIGIFGLFIGLS